MKLTQVHTIVNQATKEATGQSDLLEKDLSNITDVGKEVIGAEALDHYTKSLVNHIGRVVVDSREYTTVLPSVLKDSWEYGSILERIKMDLIEAEENPTWALEDGKDYSPNIFYQPKVTAKFFNSKTTFEIPISFTELQVKESFSSAEQLNAFVSMIQNAVSNSITVKMDSLVMDTINNGTAETLVSDLLTEDDVTLDLTKSGNKAINLLALYNADKDVAEQLTADKAIKDAEFIKFASYTIQLYKDRLARISTIFNVEGKQRFTPESENHLVLLTDFASASKVYLESEAYNKELLALPKYETVPYWQGSGTGYDFADVSKISVKTAGTNKTVEANGIIGVMFDNVALGVTNLDQRVQSSFNPKAEFYNNFYKNDVGFFNDLGENFVVFFVA